MPLCSVEDLEAHLVRLLDKGISASSLVVIEEHPDYPGELVFQVLHKLQDRFYSRYHDWLSPQMVLTELFNLDAFVALLEREKWTVVFDPSTAPILCDYYHWVEPLAIEGYELHPFQQFSLRRAFERDFWFFNWSTGAGKSFCAAAGAKHLFAQGEIDLVIACTVSKSKIDLCRFFEHAKLDAVIPDGDKAKRRKAWGQDHQVYVLNYEKLWVDHDLIEPAVHGLRVLYVFDECQKIVSDSIANYNKARRAFGKLAHMTRPKVWPMSASVVNGNPQRFRDVFSLGAGENPLGTPAQFEQRYADDVRIVPKKTPKGRYFNLRFPEWNEHKLTEVRHRVGSRTQVVRKTDPGVREYFKGIATIVVPITPSKAERVVMEAIIDRAWAAYHRDEGLNPYYNLLRYVCNTPEALSATDWDIAAGIRADFKGALAEVESTKLGVLNEKLESIREQGDQVLVFTHFTHLGLHLIADKIEVPHLTHYGVGQTNKESQRVKDEFKANPDITCLLTSDAGKEGASFQNARYVIQYDPLYSYDDTMQRASRIDRADSHLDGLTNYVFVTEDSVEERLWEINHARRRLSAAVQGSTEELSHGERERARRSEAENVSWLIFGSRMDE